MEEKNIRKKTITNLLWRFAERVGAQGVSFIVSIVLARLLMPKDYGMIALVTIFITILNVFVDSGMGNALIQKKDADDLDFSSVFYFNVVVCFALYAVMFFAAGLIADFYNNPGLVPVIRVICLQIVISGLKNVQQAYVSKNLMFKRFFYATLGGTLISAVIGIFCAYIGLGVWALVIQQLTNTGIDTLILWITVKWRPKLMFSWERLKRLLSFGWKLLVSGLLDVVYNNLRGLFIGKIYTAADLAYYNKGNQFPNLIVSNINTSINSVLLPVMSESQDDKARVKSMTRTAIRTSCYIICPLMMGLAVCAKPIVSILLTDKWLDCVPYLQIFCLAYFFLPMTSANLNAIQALGRSDIFLKLEILKKVLGIVTLIAVIKYGPLAICIMQGIMTPICSIINAVPNKKLLNYSYLEQLKDLLSTFIITIIMGVIVYSVLFLNLNMVLTLAIQVVVGVVVYILISKIFHVESFEYVCATLKKFMKKTA